MKRDVGNVLKEGGGRLNPKRGESMGADSGKDVSMISEKTIVFVQH